MPSITFLIVLHNHQPVGNFDDVFEAVYQSAYRPFLEVLDRHPVVPVGLHVSGCLFDWLETRHPEYLESVSRLRERGQIELLTGGYFEPVLPAIGEADRFAQIARHRAYLESRFGATPTGLWLAERVWEPDLPRTLVDAGIDYTLLDDSHFQTAGLRSEQLWRCWVTEDQGRALRVLPISRELRYTIPFRPPETTLDLLRRRAAEAPDRVAVLGDDGEKFGGWPDTHRAVYEDGWLDRFFTLLEENQDWIRLRFPGDAAAAEPEGKVYLPAASYPEMMEWALPAREQIRIHALARDLEPRGPEIAKFIRGGFWRNFLARYPESDHMHKRVAALRERVDDLDRRKTAVRQRILDRIHAAQCNCAYWHGVFGGLYLPHLRDAVYRRLLEAETLLEEQEHEDRSWVEAETGDYDSDGHEELRVANADLTVVVSPREGGSLREVSYKPLAVALTNGLTRRREAYHGRVARAVVRGSDGGPEGGSIHDRVLAKEAGLQNRLHVDAYRRASLVDHWLRGDARLADFDRGTHGEQGDFLGHPYEVSIARSDQGVTALLRRTGTVWKGGEPHRVAVEKRLRLAAGASRLEAAYGLELLGPVPLDTRFGVEWNLGLLAGDSPLHGYRIPGVEPSASRLGSRGVTEGVEEMACVDGHRGFEVRLRWDRPATLWRLPVETVSLSEDGFERIYQSSCLLPHWTVALDPGEVFRVTLSLEVGRIP